MKPELMTDSEIEIYREFEYPNYRKGFLGELAVDKALDDLGLAYSSNPKGSAEEYSNSEGRGPDQRIGGSISIEDKNWGGYETTPDMYQENMRR